MLHRTASYRLIVRFWMFGRNGPLVCQPVNVCTNIHTEYLVLYAQRTKADRRSSEEKQASISRHKLPSMKHLFPITGLMALMMMISYPRTVFSSISHFFVHCTHVPTHPSPIRFHLFIHSHPIVRIYHRSCNTCSLCGVLSPVKTVTQSSIAEPSIAYPYSSNDNASVTSFGFQRSQEKHPLRLNFLLAMYV